jgi:hypothetical protein
MFSATFNIFTIHDSVKIEGFVWIMRGTGGNDFLQVEITSPYTDLDIIASISDNAIEFNKKIIKTDDDPSGVLLTHLYNVCRTFEENISIIKERASTFMKTEEYEKFSIYNDLKRELREKTDAMMAAYMSDKISHLPEEFNELKEKLREYEKFTEDYRSPLFDEIPVICGIDISDEHISILLNKFIH